MTYHDDPTVIVPGSRAAAIYDNARGDYAKRARLVVARANVNLDYRCPRCGEPARPGDRCD